MFGRISTIFAFLLTCTVAGMLQPQVASGSEAAGNEAHAGVHLTDVVIFDDWPMDSLIDPGTINCPGGEMEWINPFTPVCPGSGRIHMRNMAGYGCALAMSGETIEPRLSGVELFVVNGNLDADWSGPVWGTWMTVPSPDCNPDDLIDPPVYWKGTWQGQRSMYCEGALCSWIGDLKLVGKGYGGDIEGIHLNGNEVITTFTPLPIPWEFLGLPVTGPEGVITATIKE